MIRSLTSVIGVFCAAAALSTVPSASADAGSYVRTQSGATRCLVMADDVGHGGGPAVACEYGSGFPEAPMGPAGARLSLAVVTGAGAFRWDDGNIGGGDEDTVLDYGQTYHLRGWTIQPSSEGTRFTNDKTGHGMFVSIEHVSAF